MNTPSLAVDLTVTPQDADADTMLDIRGAVHNHGTAVIDTQLWASKLLVNGEPLSSWTLAIANGLRDEREFALPPGEAVQFCRQLPASSVLPTPGRYTLALDVQGVKSPQVTVERR